MQKVGFGIKEEDLPIVCGYDAAGEVYALGEGVQGWDIGEKVYVPPRLRFALEAEYQRAPVDSFSALGATTERPSKSTHLWMFPS